MPRGYLFALLCVGFLLRLLRCSEMELAEVVLIGGLMRCGSNWVAEVLMGSCFKGNY